MILFCEILSLHDASIVLAHAITDNAQEKIREM